MLIFLLILFLFAAVPTILAWREWRKWYYLWREGMIAPIEVRHHWEAKMGVSRMYFIMYDFEGVGMDDAPFFISGHSEIELEMYCSLLNGESLEVRYAASKPHLYQLIGKPSDRWRWTLGSLAAWGYFLFVMVLGLN